MTTLRQERDDIYAPPVKWTRSVIASPVSRGRLLATFEGLRRTVARKLLGSNGVFPGFDMLDFKFIYPVDAAIEVIAKVTTYTDRRHSIDYLARVLGEADAGGSAAVLARSRGVTLHCGGGSITNDRKGQRS